MIIDGYFGLLPFLDKDGGKQNLISSVSDIEFQAYQDNGYALTALDNEDYEILTQWLCNAKQLEVEDKYLNTNNSGTVVGDYQRTSTYTAKTIITPIVFREGGELDPFSLSFSPLGLQSQYDISVGDRTGTGGGRPVLPPQFIYNELMHPFLHRGVWYFRSWNRYLGVDFWVSADLSVDSEKLTLNLSEVRPTITSDIQLQLRITDTFF